MSDPIAAWQCIGCGRIEAPQTCIGVCQDRKIFLVSMDEHKEALDQIQNLLTQTDAMQRLLTRIALLTPNAASWEISYRAAQSEARSLLATL